ncbi:hypothetical protein [Janthinobacterium sp. 1_2014MBL_MicDiv]|nr:hypothetical protein [Janthinobacterium sp. 1_2014MBL_MicDiv]
MDIFILRKNKASLAIGLAVDNPDGAPEFCTFFVDKIVRKAMHGILSD